MKFELTITRIAEPLKNNGEHYFQAVDSETVNLKYQHLTLDKSRESAKKWANWLDITHDWAEVLNELMQLPQDFRCEVWEIWHKGQFSE